jgi:hypothetical protein
MVTVRLNKKPYQICNTWEEVEAERLTQVYRDEEGNIIPTTSKHELKALSNIPHDLIDATPDIQLFPLYTIISFIHEAELMPYVEAENVASSQYRKFEGAKHALRDGKPYRKIISAAQVYYPDEKNSVRLVGLGISIVNQVAIFLQNYTDMINATPEKNEVEAGIEELAAFSYWGTAYVMAGRNLLNVDAILAKPAIEVYTAMYYSFKEAKYNKEKFRLDHPEKKT